MRRILTAVALFGLMVSAVCSLTDRPVKAGGLEIRKYMIINGGNYADSSEVPSAWVNVFGASRVYLRTWSIGATADTDFCDTILTWKTLFSDSICCQVTGQDGFLRGSAAQDSVVLTGNGADSTKNVSVIGAPSGVAKIIRASASGSGIFTIVYPSPALGTVPLAGVNLPNSPDVFATQYMRIRVTPRTRLTTAGFSSTQGIRTRGIHGLRVQAIVVYPNK